MRWPAVLCEREHLFQLSMSALCKVSGVPVHTPQYPTYVNIDQLNAQKWYVIWTAYPTLYIIAGCSIQPTNHTMGSLNTLALTLGSEFKTCHLLYLLTQFRNKNYFHEWLRLKIHSVKRLTRKTLKVGNHLRSLGWHKEKVCAWQHVKTFSSELLPTLCSPGLTQTCSSRSLRQQFPSHTALQRGASSKLHNIAVSGRDKLHGTVFPQCCPLIILVYTAK